ncbi:hypothetical protein L3X38_042657 [Prunus dulcis]|uniref:Uncharacterized protein n=1 Tax=Prunus dulcis TaxID=3755 RepID=A0AAD4UWP3_PRUDU|nr:hypothetical protein L3X38_042657 [Prunus dulcis]
MPRMGPVRTPENPTSRGTSTSYHNISPYAETTNAMYGVCLNAGKSYATTVEAAKEAIDDPQKTLGGRNIIVKLADSHKGRTVQAQLLPAMVPLALPLAAGYPQPGKAHAGANPVGYGYPQTVAAYPDSSYPSPPTAPYQAQSQIPYPYYIGKQ